MDESGEATPTLLPVGEWLLVAAVTVWGYLASARWSARRYERRIAREWLVESQRKQP